MHPKTRLIISFWGLLSHTCGYPVYPLLEPEIELSCRMKLWKRMSVL